MMITLTDIDGVQFQADAELITLILDRGAHREINFIDSSIKVKESVGTILAKITEAKNDNTV